MIAATLVICSYRWRSASFPLWGLNPAALATKTFNPAPVNIGAYREQIEVNVGSVIVANDCNVPILLKNSMKMEVYFSANNQTIMNFPQELVCELTSRSVGRDC
jgi:hypothetical protein